MFYIHQQIDSAIELLEKGEAVDISQLPPVPSVPQASSGMFTISTSSTSTCTSSTCTSSSCIFGNGNYHNKAKNKLKEVVHCCKTLSNQ